ATMAIAYDQLDPIQAARDQAAQELRPERSVLARPHVETEHLALANGVDADGDDDRHVRYSSILARLHKCGVHPQVRVRPVEPACSEPLDLSIKFLAQPTDLALADAAHAERLHQVIDAPRADALDVRLLDHRHQRTLSTPPRLEQTREKR